jgi:hypothetical protein
MNALMNERMHKDAFEWKNAQRCIYGCDMQKPYDGLVSSLSTTVVNMLVRIGQETACLPMSCSVSKQNCGL